MMVEFPEVDMDSISAADQKQTYWLLYQMMKDDFVHKQDLALILNSATVVGAVTGTCSAGPVAGNIIPIPGMIIWTPIEINAVAKSIAYKAFATAGGAVREGIISGLESTVK